MRKVFVVSNGQTVQPRRYSLVRNRLASVAFVTRIDGRLRIERLDVPIEDGANRTLHEAGERHVRSRRAATINDLHAKDVVVIPLQDLLRFPCPEDCANRVGFHLKEISRYPHAEAIAPGLPNLLVPGFNT